MASIHKRYRHKKSGHVVTILHLARLQTTWPTLRLDDMQIMVVYEHDGHIWVRSETEFDDGRFEEV